MVTGKDIALSINFKKEKKSPTNTLRFHLKKIYKKQRENQTQSKQKEVNNNDVMEHKNNRKKKSVKPKGHSFRSSSKLTNLDSSIRKKTQIINIKNKKGNITMNWRLTRDTMNNFMTIN